MLKYYMQILRPSPSFSTYAPMVMHIDLNSCFATIEQQANRLLRGRPIGVSAYDTPRGFVLAASYEAKARGIKLGVNNQQARELCPGIIILTPDPAKYREAHRLFKRLLLDYTSDVTPKSIDEFVVNFEGSPALAGLRASTGCATLKRHNERMLEIAGDIKQRIRETLGEWVTVNIGIGTNRFLAKYAAGFGKPDGLKLIDHTNLRQAYEGADLTDLPGINVRYRARLMACGISTPLEFLDADVRLLKKVVFKSVVGYYWWARLRGYEVDDRTFSTKSIGHQYALPKQTNDRHELARLLMKLCEKVGRRLRKKTLCARGIHLYFGFAYQPETQTDAWRDASGVRHAGFENLHRLSSWHEGHRLGHRLYATSDIYHAATALLERADLPAKVRIMAITVYDLEPWSPEQLGLFTTSPFDKNTPCTGARQGIAAADPSKWEQAGDEAKRLSDAMDAINDHYGEYVVVPGTMLDIRGEILDRIAFGGLPE